MRSILVPLAIYLAITLGIPLANGAAARSEFWSHAAEVVLVAAMLVASRGVAWFWNPKPLPSFRLPVKNLPAARGTVGRS